MKISNISISKKHKPLIIAEMSGNHNQSLKRALEIVRIAYNSGIKVIKLQTYKPETITINSKRKEFYIKNKKNLWSGENLFNLYKKAHTPWEWHEEIFAKAKEYKMICFSSAFDETSVDFLNRMKTPAFKIASFEINHLPLIKKIAKVKKPVIISSGMATFKEIQCAINTLKDNGCNNYALLKCTSNYPADPSDSNLITIADMRKKFKCEVGLSDHTPGIGSAVSSISFGATIIEKHFTLNRNDGGVDSKFSLEPDEFEILIKECERAWKSIGNVFYGPSKAEKSSLKYRRSIYVYKDIKKGEVLTSDNIKIIRPNHGLQPFMYEKILGKKVLKNLKAGSPLRLEHIKK